MRKCVVSAGLTILLISMPLLAFAANDVQIVDMTNFGILTSDTAVPVTVTAAAGGQVTNINVQANYMDITLDNLSAVTFNVATASRYLKVTKVSGLDDYTISPVCPTNTVTMTGTGAQVILRLQVQTTNPCPVAPPSGGGGGGGGGQWIPVEPPIIPTAACPRTSLTTVPFIDIKFHWAETYIDSLYSRCIIDGRTSTIFAPDDYATRAELVKIVLNTYKLGTAPYEHFFLDVFINDWFAGYVTNSAKRGIVIGYINPDGTSNFKPNQYITRAEALKVMLKTKGITDFSGYTANFADVSIGDWYYDYVAYAQAKGILIGYTETYGLSGSVRDLYSFPNALGQGMYNDEVKSLKEVLAQLGYYSGTIDPAYDQQLVEAVKNYQTAREIISTGFFGDLTKAALLNEVLVPVTITNFRPNSLITRAEIAKIDVLVEQL